MTDHEQAAGRDRGRERLVRLASFDNFVDAEVSKAKLEDAGIRALLKNADALAANQGFALPLAQDLYVLEGDAEAAAALLDEMPAEEPVRRGHRPHHRRRPDR